MKNTNTILALSLVTLFNAGCSGCVGEKKVEIVAPVAAQEVQAPVVAQAEPAKQQVVQESVQEEAQTKKTSDVFKWANRGRE